jgi:hypothetical protein
MADDFIMKDNGEREASTTGYLREPNSGRGRYDLVSPIALKRIAVVYERGADKYGDRNWEKGGNISRFLNSSIRHTQQFIEGLRDEDHLAQAAWNLMSVIHILECIDRGLLPPEFNDLSSFIPEEKK